MRILAYVYNGYHPIEERDRAFYPGFTEWDLIESSAPRFPGHRQPLLPAHGRYDDRLPAVTAQRIAWCHKAGIDGLVHGFFWCRGKRVFQQALDEGFLGSEEGRRFPFALMWANRMPRRVLPVRRDEPLIDPARRVPADVADFVQLITYLGSRYFLRPNYLRVDNAAYLSIYDSSFFVRELGVELAARAIALARAELRRRGLPDLHLAAVEPELQLQDRLRAVGFDSVTHYVLLPAWRGPSIQDYSTRARIVARSWSEVQGRCRLPHHPAVSPGWDASARGADFGHARPDRYPWSPVVVNADPHRFEQALRRAIRYARASGLPTAEQLVFVASLNEWSEGHYLEPDVQFGDGWLQAVARARVAEKV